MLIKETSRFIKERGERGRGGSLTLLHNCPRCLPIMLPWDQYICWWNDWAIKKRKRKENQQLGLKKVLTTIFFAFEMDMCIVFELILY
jgi:hypothetical protein